MVERVVTPAGVVMAHAPPAIVFAHDPHCQMPTAWRFMFCLPQNGHTNLLRGSPVQREKDVSGDTEERARQEAEEKVRPEADEAGGRSKEQAGEGAGGAGG